MTIWPVELYSYVFQLACTDDGSTVLNLSLVSKQFREIARPFLYQSLVLSTPQKSGLLLEKTKNLLPHLRRIEHLFIAPTHDADHETCSPNNTIILRIAQLAAPTLKTLVLIAPCLITGTSLISFLFRLQYPNLEELTIAGLYPFSFHWGSFPRLTRLHFAGGNRNPHGLFQVGALDEAFPALTHLRVSGIARALSFVDELGYALRCGRDLSEADKPEYHSHSGELTTATLPRVVNLAQSQLNALPAPLPSGLQVIYVQPSISDGRDIRQTPSRLGGDSNRNLLSRTTKGVSISTSIGSTNRQQVMMERLEKLQDEFDVGAPNVRMVVLDAEGSEDNGVDNPTTVAQLKANWLDRLNDKDGAWAMAPSFIE